MKYKLLLPSVFSTCKLLPEHYISQTDELAREMPKLNMKGVLLYQQCTSISLYFPASVHRISVTSLTRKALCHGLCTASNVGCASTCMLHRRCAVLAMCLQSRVWWTDFKRLDITSREHKCKFPYTIKFVNFLDRPFTC